MPKVEVTSDTNTRVVNDARSALLIALYEFTPSNWHESPSAIATLERAKLVLTPRQRRKLDRWLADHSKR